MPSLLRNQLLKGLRRRNGTSRRNNTTQLARALFRAQQRAVTRSLLSLFGAGSNASSASDSEGGDFTENDTASFSSAAQSQLGSLLNSVLSQALQSGGGKLRSTSGESARSQDARATWVASRAQAQADMLQTLEEGRRNL